MTTAARSDLDALRDEIIGSLARWREQAMALWELTAKIGAALCSARKAMPDEMWLSWLDGIGITPYGAFVFMRAGAYPELMRTHQPGSIEAIRRLLPQGQGTAYDEDQAAMARRLADGGMTRRAVAVHFGASQATIKRWLEPEEWARQRAAQAEAKQRRELAKRERELRKRLAVAPKPVSEAYKLATRLDGVLGQARSEARDNEQRIAINEAHAARDKMMDAIVKALGVS